MNSKHSAKTQQTVIDRIMKDNVPVGIIVEETGIPRSTIYYWIKRHNDRINRKKNEISLKNHRLLENKVARLEGIIKILKTVDCTVKDPLEIKLSELEKLHGKYNVHMLCEALDVSRDDKNGNLESMSIANQRQMLTDYVFEKGWVIHDVYIDDGYSGTNFNRPDFNRMISDIEIGKINCVVTKDLSRLGRNYSKVGYYTDEFFVENGIRFIAVNDSYDSHREEENEIAPFKNVLNEWYPRDISKKVRQVKKSNAQQGKFMGSQAPYGYRKSSLDKHILEIDPYAAGVMCRIFAEFAAGDSARKIAERLNLEGIDSPRFYFSQFPGGQHPKPSDNNHWGSGSIMQMLRNQVYIGNMVQGKRRIASFKTKKCVTVSPDRWIVVEGTHEPLIDIDTWKLVQHRFG